MSEVELETVLVVFIEGLRVTVTTTIIETGLIFLMLLPFLSEDADHMEHPLYQLRDQVGRTSRVTMLI